MVPVLSLRCACPPEDTTRQAQGDCVGRDSDKAAGGPGGGTAAASIGPHARVDPGARRRPRRLHGFPAHNGPRRNPSEGCGQARSNTGAPDGVASLARCAPSVHAPWAWRMTSAPLPVRPGKRPRRAAPRRPSTTCLGFALPRNPPRWTLTGPPSSRSRRRSSASRPYSGLTLRPLLDIATEDSRYGRVVAALSVAESAPRSPPRPRSAPTCWRRSPTIPTRSAAAPGPRRRRRRPPAPATSPASSAPTWRRAASASTPRAAPATRRTSPRRRTSSASGSRRSTRSRASSRRRRRAAGRRRQRDRARRGRPRRVAATRRASPSTRGEEVDLGDVAELLVEAGYERVDQVEERGQFALRGGILDVFPATEERAVRLELFGDEIESLRWFSTFTQRSLGEAEAVELDARRRARRRAPRARRARARGRERRRSARTSRSCLPLDSLPARRSTCSPTRPRS